MAMGIRSFYGKRKNMDDLEIRLARQERNVKKQYIPEPYKPRICGPSHVWQVFHRQLDALNYASRWPQELCVFSFESSSLGEQRGQRLFLVASSEVFWHYYRQLNNQQRHHYEVIAEGSPCRLYFDLEFSKEHNPDSDGNAMTEVIIKLMVAAVKAYFNLDCSIKQVLQLDASTTNKYSCHLVFTQGTLIFQNNVQAGTFIKHVLSQLWTVLQRLDDSPSTVHSSTCQNPGHSSKDEEEESADSGSRRHHEDCGKERSCREATCEMCRCHKSGIERHMCTSNGFCFPKQNFTLESQSVPGQRSRAKQNCGTKLDKDIKESQVVKCRGSYQSVVTIKSCRSSCLHKNCPEYSPSRIHVAFTEAEGSGVQRKCDMRSNVVSPPMNCCHSATSKCGHCCCDGQCCVTDLQDGNGDGRGKDTELSGSLNSDSHCSMDSSRRQHAVSSRTTIPPWAAMTEEVNSTLDKLPFSCRGSSCNPGSTSSVQVATDTGSRQSDCDTTVTAEEGLTQMSAIIREAGSRQSDCDTTVTAEEGLTQMSAIIREAGSHQSDCDTTVTAEEGLTQMSAIIREAGSHQSDCDTTVTAEEGLTQMSAIIREAGLTVEDLKTLVVSNKHGERGFFIDTGVYTKNRNFRLYLSSKLGKDNPLVLSNNNKWQAGIDFKEDDLQQQIFVASLITKIGSCPKSTLLTFGDETEEGLIPKISHGKRSSKKMDSLAGYQQSPYPEVDAFIISTLTKGGVQGAIRRWAYFSEEEIITYDILHNRWCEHIQRQHKSNNIIIVVNLRQGVYYQKCQDPDCKAVHFKSKEQPLPACVLPAALLGDWDDGSEIDSSDLEDIDLLAAVSDLENDLEQTSWELTDEELIKLSGSF